MKKSVLVLLVMALVISASGCSKEEKQELVSSQEEIEEPEEAEEAEPKEESEAIKTEDGVINEGYTFTMRPLTSHDAKSDDEYGYREINYTFRKADECKYGWGSDDWGNPIGYETYGASTSLSRNWSYDIPPEIPISVFILVPNNDYDRGPTPLATTLEEAEEALIPQVKGLDRHFELDLHDVDNFYTTLTKDKITTQNGIEMLKVTGSIENPNTVSWDSYEEHLRFVEFTAYYFLDEDYPIGVFAVPSRMNEVPYEKSNEIRGMYKEEGFEEHVDKFIQNITKGIQSCDVAEIEMKEPEKEEEVRVEFKVDDKYNSGPTPTPNSPNAAPYTPLPKELYTFNLLDKKIVLGETKYGEISGLVTPITLQADIKEMGDIGEDAFYVKVNDTNTEIKLVVQIDDVEKAKSMDDAVIIGISIREPEKVRDIINLGKNLSSTNINDILDEIGLTKDDVFMNLYLDDDSWVVNYCDMKLTGINPKVGEGTKVTAIYGNSDGITYIKSYEMEALGNYQTSIAGRL